MKVNTASKNGIAEYGHHDEDIARVALSAFFNIAEAWDLSREASQVLLGSPSESTYYRWRQGKVATIPKDTLERISVLLGIYKAAHILFPIASRANEYMRRANDDFAGKSALDVMLSGSVDALYQVRRYLDAWRG
ncbi:MAG: antitoxin Xre-like helix-turn-helix domain-containing protein [Woeseiaceae bacterium]